MLKYAPTITQNLEKKLASLPKADLSSLTNALKVEKYYKGGFETKMSRREASLILGVSPNANKIKIKEVFFLKWKLGFTMPTFHGTQVYLD